MKLSIVVPAFNEEKSMAATIKKLKVIDCIDEIIVVNDGSTDKTGKILSSLKGIRVLTHRKNLGYGAALKTGFSAAKNECIAFIDADLTYSHEMLPVLFKSLIDEELDCVWGNRFGKKRNKMSPIRKFGNLMMNLIASVIFLQRLCDINSGERIFRKEILREIDYKTLPDDLHFITAFSKRIFLRHKKFREIPVNYYFRSGRSKLRIFKHGFLMLITLLFG